MAKKKKNINDLTDAEKLQLAKMFYETAPFATKVYVAMETGLDITFVQKHWAKIESLK